MVLFLEMVKERVGSMKREIGTESQAYTDFHHLNESAFTDTVGFSDSKVDYLFVSLRTIGNVSKINTKPS